jgi:glucose/arabinose dehydrogenase
MILLRDANRDGEADLKSVVIGGLRQPYGMAYVDGRLYLAETDRLTWLPYDMRKGKVAAGASPTLIASFPAGGYNQHWTRNLLPGREKHELFIAVGSAGDAGEQGIEAEKGRAAVHKLDLRTGRIEVFAEGLRNPVGMAIEPGTGKLWVVVNERDKLGDELVPDYLAGLSRGANYGWPYAYFGAHADPRFKDFPSAELRKFAVPDFALGGHVVPLGIVFGSGLRFPASHREGAFIAQHGSAERTSLVGYNVVFLPFKAGIPSGNPQPFLTGFIESQVVVRGRPRALAIGTDGALLVVDDAGGAIWHVQARPAPSGERSPRRKR